MTATIGKWAVMGLVALGGCTTAPPAPTTTSAQVQMNFNFNPQNEAGGVKKIMRGAVSGMPQHVGFFYSVNPDCSSDGLVHMQLKQPPAHGAATFANADGYSSFPSNAPGHECNSKKSPGVEVVYTSVKDFTGTDQFTVVGIGPHGKYMETAYTVNVVPQ